MAKIHPLAPKLTFWICSYRQSDRQLLACSHSPCPPHLNTRLSEAWLISWVGSREKGSPKTRVLLSLLEAKMQNTANQMLACVDCPPTPSAGVACADGAASVGTHNCSYLLRGLLQLWPRPAALRRRGSEDAEHRESHACMCGLSSHAFCRSGVCSSPPTHFQPALCILHSYYKPCVSSPYTMCCCELTTDALRASVVTSHLPEW
jgi:hypothetical protein